MQNNLPSEGFFWIIYDEVVGISSIVPKYDYSYPINGQTHENSWSKYSKFYLDLDGNELSWDYFPRGRIMIDPNYDLTGNFEDYSCMIFLDRCINNPIHKQLISDYYNLNIPEIPHIHWTMLGERAGIDHYQCHNCKKDI